MAWEKINHVCGHTTEQQMYGAHAGRRAKAAQLGQHPCPDCRAKAAAAEAEAAGLPALTGSPKQIAWANDIRGKMIAEIDTWMAKMDSLRASVPAERAEEAAQMMADYAAAAATVRGRTEARWWIDHKDYSPRTLLEPKKG